MTTVLKLGGSVITEKDRRETLDGAALDRAADAVAGADEELVVVHGGGSFGHPHAAAHNVTRTAGTSDHEAVTEIHGGVVTLNQFVLSRLHARDVPAVPVQPLSVAHRTDDGETRFPAGAVETLLAEGFCPVTHGDGVAHADSGVTVLSGDEIVVLLARALDADRVGVCSTVPGVLDADGAVIDRIESFDAVADAFTTSDDTDVTGGMAGKVQTLLELQSSAAIFGLDELAAFLDGEAAGTRIE